MTAPVSNLPSDRRLATVIDAVAAGVRYQGRADDRHVT